MVARGRALQPAAQPFSLAANFDRTILVFVEFPRARRAGENRRCDFVDLPTIASEEPF